MAPAGRLARRLQIDEAGGEIDQRPDLARGDQHALPGSIDHQPERLPGLLCLDQDRRLRRPRRGQGQADRERQQRAVAGPHHELPGHLGGAPNTRAKIRSTCRV